MCIAGTMDLTTYLQELNYDGKTLCVIPSSVMEMVLEGNCKLLASQTATVEKLAESMTGFRAMMLAHQEMVISHVDSINNNLITMNGHLEKITNSVDNHVTTMNGHLEKVVKVLNKRAEIPATPLVAIDVEDVIIRKRNVLVEKVVRSELLSEYTTSYFLKRHLMLQLCSGRK